MDVPLIRVEKLKKQGKIYTKRSGVLAFVEGFDPDAPEPKEKFLGIF